MQLDLEAKPSQRDFYRAGNTVARGRLAADGKRWLNTGLAASDLLTLAADRQLPADERGRIALTALMRFDMTGRYEAAVKAAQQVEVDAPELAPVMQTVWLEQAPPMPQVAGVDAARRKAELAQLGALKTATGYLGDHVLQRVASKPNDADLQWLLHVVVRSTRGGCLDDDAKAVSKKAFTVLHKRYGNSAWAKKTPYFY